MTLSVELVGPGEMDGEVSVAASFATSGVDGAPPELVMATPESATARGVPVALDPAECAREGFKAKVGQVLRLSSANGRVLVIGLGNPDALEPERWRRAAAAVVRAGGEGGTAAVFVPSDAPGAALAEGALLASYRFDAYRSKPSAAALERVAFVTEQPDRLRGDFERGVVEAGAAMFARDLVNTPPSDLDPSEFARRVQERLLAQPRTTVEVWDEERVAAERLGGLETVARGSSQPPRVVMAHYTPEHPKEVDGKVPHVVLVGKGITFDSGGLSLKSADGMMTMKTDMSGAATVMAALSACAACGVPVRVSAIAMVTENMPGPNAVKPGDVFRARNGATIEVLNTDAEGRLVLADGLSLAAELEPEAIIDVATLTGAQVVALGRGIGALFGNDQALMDRIEAVAREEGEPLWQLPLPEEYAEHIDSEIADMKNMGRPGEAGSIAAAMLLSRFVGEVPWAHLDIAGPARSGESSGYLTKGGTAFGVRTLIEYVRTRAST